MIDKIIKKLRDKSILILGYGKEGRSTYNFIKKNLPNKIITILDENASIEINIDKKDNFISKKITKEILESYDLVFKSPGISLKDINVDNIKITSQIEILLEHFKENIIGVTGTKGKSTTTSLLYEVIKDQKENTYILGNIGIPVFDYIDKFNKETILVIELSSHQLEYVKHSPHIGILLNLYPEHLDHYKNLEDYYNAKLNIFKYQNEYDYTIYDSSFKEYINNKIPHLIEINDYIYIEGNYLKKNNFKLYNINSNRHLIGMHNLNNIMFVLAVSELLNLDIKRTRKVINNFKPLEHRLEMVGKYANVIYYNDSISTIPESTINCIKALKIIDTLIIGGKDRGIDYTNLIDFINKSEITNVICLPKTGHNIIDKINKKTFKVDNLEEAVIIAKKVTQKNKICALSPAASSYGYFKNFEERGNIFKELVRRG